MGGRSGGSSDSTIAFAGWDSFECLAFQSYLLEGIMTPLLSDIKTSRFRSEIFFHLIPIFLFVFEFTVRLSRIKIDFYAALAVQYPFSPSVMSLQIANSS